ncbi:uncharacterized protein LOC125526737 [Triticum urartu]|uniref:uncharacterized protein LOC125526737 n=1 Tax=Triticum urartu TaxID=4572 RepID=UPI002043B957|nr:uncharacterized protein LOC125526737 [Triticum urartu]
MEAGLNPLVVFWSGRGIHDTVAVSFAVTHVTVVVSFAVQVTLLLLADIRRCTDWPVLKAIVWSAYMLADTVFWSGRGIHVTVVVSFAVQITLLLLADIRRCTDWPVLKAIIWSAYMLADTTAIYALGHLSVVVTSTEHRLMALWAPLLLVHLGGQDNITAYAIEDNRLWLRHLQAFGVQLLAAGYVLYASSILFHPSLLRWAAILMYVVGVLKCGERVWALMGANSCASSSLSITSYMDFHAEQACGFPADCPVDMAQEVNQLVIAYSLLDIPKKMFEGPTPYVKIENDTSYEGDFILEVVQRQLTMMYDLLFTKAAVMHTRYGFAVRLISLPFTVAALQLLFHALRDEDGYRRADVIVTKVLLIGAVILEAISVMRFTFSMWTAALLYERKWYLLGWVDQLPELVFSLVRVIVQRREIYSSGSGHMRQQSLFKVFFGTNHSRGSRIARSMGLADLWDSTFYSWSTPVPTAIIEKVLELVSATDGSGSNDASQIDITNSRGRNTLRRYSLSFFLEKGYSLSLGKDLAWSVGLDLDESILVWHITTHVYLEWLEKNALRGVHLARFCRENEKKVQLLQGTRALCNYMFYLLVARSYILPVTRQRYIQLCHDLKTRYDARDLLDAILYQKDALLGGSPVQPNGMSQSSGTAQPPVNNTGVGGTAQPSSINSTLDLGCKLAAQLLHTAEKEVDVVRILEMVFEVWVEMLCYTVYHCNEKSHARNLTNGGELMTIVALMMVYKSNGFIKSNGSSA